MYCLLACKNTSFSGKPFEIENFYRNDLCLEGIILCLPVIVCKMGIRKGFCGKYCKKK